MSPCPPTDLPPWMLPKPSLCVTCCSGDWWKCCSCLSHSSLLGRTSLWTLGGCASNGRLSTARTRRQQTNITARTPRRILILVRPLDDIARLYFAPVKLLTSFNFSTCNARACWVDRRRRERTLAERDKFTDIYQSTPWILHKVRQCQTWRDFRSCH